MDLTLLTILMGYVSRVIRMRAEYDPNGTEWVLRPLFSFGSFGYHSGVIRVCVFLFFFNKKKELETEPRNHSVIRMENTPGGIVTINTPLPCVTRKRRIVT